jgi:murein hydrolase activator
MRRAVLILLLAGFAAAPAVAQRDEQLAAEQRLRELQGQIALFEERLTSARAEESTAVDALTTLDREISVREALIETYARRMTQLQSETIAIENELEHSEKEMNRLREEYARYARQAYMRGRVGDLALILSAGSINQMLVRARYLQRLADHRQRAAQRIIDAQQQLAQRRVELDSTVAQVQTVLAESRVEGAQLARRKREREQMVTQLRQQRTRLQAEVRQREAEAQRLNSRIQQLIAEAEADRRRAAEAERLRAEAERRAGATPEAAAASSAPEAARTAPVPSVSEAEFARLSGSFRQNRGQLPWPVSGVVTEGFGPRRNAVTGTTIMNPGIIINTAAMAPVRTIFTGEVARVFVMPGWGTCVLVTHGDFHTVYGNLSSVDVQQGQRIEAGHVVGRSGTADQPLGAAAFFAVFEGGGTAVDPGLWLARR